MGMHCIRYQIMFNFVYLALNNALCFVTVLRLGCVVCALADYMHVCVLEWLVPLLSERVVST